jgi:oligoribonuclease
VVDLKRVTPDKILWLDLEMTGLNPEKDRIVEVAAMVTDWQFKELETFESLIAHDAKEIEALINANPWYKKFPQHKTDFLKAATHGMAEIEVQKQLLELINRHFAPNMPALLAGNSIHCDRGFIKQWWPDVDARLHYRMLDVSAWKVVMIAKYNRQYQKKETHRAMSDVCESIAELQYYLESCSSTK